LSTKLHDEPETAANLAVGPGTTTFGTLGDINVIGLWTLYAKEVRRFLKVVTQTVMAPLVTTLVFLAIFSLALGAGRPAVEGVAFIDFLAPGLVVMAIVQNAFANTSSSIMIAKVQGNIVDYLMPPLSAGELLFGVVMGGVTRGMLVGAVVWIGMLPFVAMQPAHLWAILYFSLMASLLLSILGFLAALWAEKFDHMAAVTNFVITPLSFLSGTFYSINRLPEVFHGVALANPFFHMIDGVRYGFTDHSDGNVLLGALFLALVNGALWFLALRLVRLGYKLKA
jgi:ABC-2 type transport system permease protein